jgi:hypothetical protein
MTHASKARTNIVVLLLVLAVSALSMIWLFWHHPLTTSIATVGVLAALGVSAKLARSMEVEKPDLDQPST